MSDSFLTLNLKIAYISAASTNRKTINPPTNIHQKTSSCSDATGPRGSKVDWLWSG